MAGRGLPGPLAGAAAAEAGASHAFWGTGRQVLEGQPAFTLRYEEFNKSLGHRSFLWNCQRYAKPSLVLEMHGASLANLVCARPREQGLTP